jgi:hypothetical protein
MGLMELTSERGMRKLDGKREDEARYNLKYRNTVLIAYRLMQVKPPALPA